MKQTISWFDPHASVEAAIAGQAVISQFFFDTNVRTIRPADQVVLNRLIHYLRNNLRERRVELALVGHADHRGKDAYNELLSRDRVEAIASVLNRELRNTQKYSHISGIAMGEKGATQQTKDAAVLGWDRRVDVHSSSLIYAWPDLQNKMKIIPGVLRISHMEWIKADYKDITIKRPGGLAEFLKGKAVDWLMGKILPDENPLAPGKEREWMRRLKEVNPAHRVTAVKIKATNKDGLAISSLTTEVTYTWGFATPNITVNYEYKSTNFLGLPEPDPKSKTLTLPRVVAERSPFYFPQKDWRPIRVGRR